MTGALAVRAAQAMTVHSETSEPVYWSDLIERMDGGFFQTPLSLALTVGPCTPLFLTFHCDGDVAGIALAGMKHCSLGGVPHIQLPSAPAVARPDQRAECMRVLLEHMRSVGAADVRIGSFDAHEFVEGHDASVGSARTEYPVTLSDPESQLAAFATTHRRHVRRGQRSGWTMRAVTQDAASLLHAAQSTAAQRSRMRGSGFATSLLPSGVSDHLERGGDGLALFVAEEAGQLLAAALVGWGGRRAFYIRGGSSQAGYECHAAVWLQWRIMAELRRRGVSRYNLGGTPGAARDPQHAEHGLRRYKLAFGSTESACRGLHAELRPGHMGLHRSLFTLRKILSNATGR